MAFYPPSANCKQLIMNANVQLDYPYSPEINVVTVADIIDVSATAINLKIILPNSQATGTGFSITFNNFGAHNINLVLYDGATVLTELEAGKIISIYLFNNDTTNGNWRVINCGNGISAIANITLESPDDSIIITDGVIEPPNGIVKLTLPTFLSSITEISKIGNGLTTLSTPVPGGEQTWGISKIQEGVNITIENGDALLVNSPITVSLNKTIAVETATIGNILIENSSISSIIDNDTFNIYSKGVSSKLNLNTVHIDINGNISNINNLTVSGSLHMPNVPKAWCRFNNTSGEIETQSKFNVSTVIHNPSFNQYTISFIIPMGNLNYSVFINCANNNSTPPLETRIGYDIIKQLDHVVIVLTDSSGEMLPDIPEGVSVMIYSLT